MIDLRRRLPTLLIVAAVLTGVVPMVSHRCFDLAMYRLGGRAVLDGQPLYDVRHGPLGFTYPPFAGLLAAPVATLPTWLATAVMIGGSVAALWVVLRHGAGEVLRRPTAPMAVGLVALVCCYPVRETLWLGQVNLLLAALVVSDVQGRRWRGCGVGIAAAIKLTPAIFIAYLLVTGRRREARNATLAFGAATLGTAALLPADSARFWLHDVIAAPGIGDESGTVNQSLHGTVLRLMGAGGASTAAWLLLAVVVGAVGLRMAGRLAREGREPFAVGVVGVTGCLVSPVSWVHHWVWCIPLLVGLMTAARTVAARIGVAVLGLVFAAWDEVARLPQGWPPLAFVLDNDVVVCVFATSVIVLAARALHSRRASARLELALG